MMTVTPRAIVLAGPTASGKTSLALVLAQSFPIEIISMDSALVYCGMDIGTAKPSAAEQSLCPHHLIDTISPMQAYSAAQFHDDANRLIREIGVRGRIPVLVGGTMLYYKVLLEGLSALPQADEALRNHISQEAARVGWPAMHQQLAQLDPITAARLNSHDAQRIHRALEVCLISGKAMSALLVQRQPATRDIRFLPLALVPAQREQLYQAITSRFKAMLKQGFVDEVQQLRAHYPELTPALPAMRCVGYRQVWTFLEQQSTLQQLERQGIAATCQMAKRQLTWIRSLKMIPVCMQQLGRDGSVQRAVEAFLCEQSLPEALRFTGKY